MIARSDVLLFSNVIFFILTEKPLDMIVLRWSEGLQDHQTRTNLYIKEHKLIDKSVLNNRSFKWISFIFRRSFSYLPKYLSIQQYCDDPRGFMEPQIGFPGSRERLVSRTAIHLIINGFSRIFQNYFPLILYQAYTISTHYTI